MGLIKKLGKLNADERSTRRKEITEALQRKQTQINGLKPLIKSAKKQTELKPLKARRESIERQMRNLNTELAHLDVLG